MRLQFYPCLWQNVAALTLLIDARRFNKPSIFTYLDIELVNAVTGILQVRFF